MSGARNGSGTGCDIDGLRAISVLAVVLFHTFPHVVRGGFIGVDVFFVISGFLITGIISKSIETNNFSIVWFYRQRILRIFPALIIVLAAAYGLGWVCLYADEFKRLAFQIIGGATFTANIVLWTETGYFDVAAATKPLLHLWSLGVEEQFYILWPLLLIVGKRLRVSSATAIALLAAVSFVIEIASIGAHPMAAFFLPFGRMWELAAGGLTRGHVGQVFYAGPDGRFGLYLGFRRYCRGSGSFAGRSGVSRLARRYSGKRRVGRDRFRIPRLGQPIDFAAVVVGWARPYQLSALSLALGAPFLRCSARWRAAVLGEPPLSARTESCSVLDDLFFR